jgi:UDP-N-acetylmuramoyl-tripeptide--D-alanyl-D-alanine ligase
VRSGDAFVALAGARGHGIEHADAALAAGARFLISDRPHPRALLVRDAAAALARLGRHARAQRRGPVVGVTGSVGKTTTKTLLGAALAAQTSPGNVNTPHALACVLVDAWLHEPPELPLVIELGIDHRGEMERLLDLVRPSHGVLTAIAEVHLDGLRSLEGVAREKARLLHAAGSGRYVGEVAWRHLNDAERAASTLVALGPGTPGGRYVPAERALEARLLRPDGAVEGVALTLPGLGAPLAQAALLALQVAVDLGVAAPTAAARIERAQLEPRRLQAHALGPLTLLDDAYNASPLSARAAFEVLALLPPPHAAVLGDMRELASRSAAAHAELGRLAGSAGLERVWFVGPESLRAFEAATAVPERHHLADADAMLAARGALPRRGTLLVKGSRSVGLDRLVDAVMGERREAVTS